MTYGWGSVFVGERRRQGKVFPKLIATDSADHPSATGFRPCPCPCEFSFSFSFSLGWTTPRLPLTEFMRPYHSDGSTRTRDEHGELRGIRRTIRMPDRLSDHMFG